LNYKTTNISEEPLLALCLQVALDSQCMCWSLHMLFMRISVVLDLTSCSNHGCTVRFCKSTFLTFR